MSRKGLNTRKESKWRCIKLTIGFVLGASLPAVAQVPRIGDFNGDRKSDVVVWYPDTGDWQVAFSDGSKFAPQPGSGNGHWLYGWAANPYWYPLIGDFNGDGKTDIAVWYQPTGDWQVAFSDGSKFVPQPGAGNGHWLYGWGQSQNWSWVPFVGDFNGDGKSDILVWYPPTGDWQVAFSDGSKFVPQPGSGAGHWLLGWAQSSDWRPVIGDFNGDRKTDIAVWYPSTGDWQVAFSDGLKFTPQPGRGDGHWLIPWAQGATSWVPMIGDINADHRSDIVVWYPTTGDWQVAASDGFEFVPQPGAGNGHWLYGWAQSWSWTTFVGDFNGDGKSDIVVWYRDTGDWQVAFSDGFKFVPQPGSGNGHWLLGWARVAPAVLN